MQAADIVPERLLDLQNRARECVRAVGLPDEVQLVGEGLDLVIAELPATELIDRVAGELAKRGFVEIVQ